jgi:rare lipoprotein A
MNPRAMTAAHRTRAFGSHITVTDLRTGRGVTVRINDQGPFVRGRCH